MTTSGGELQTTYQRPCLHTPNTAQTCSQTTVFVWLPVQWPSPSLLVVSLTAVHAGLLPAPAGEKIYFY